MEDLVLERNRDVDWAASEPAWLAELREEIVELRAEVAQLRRENLELRQQAGYWRSQHAVAKQRIAELEQEVAQLRGEKRKLQDQLFGRKSESSATTDRSNRLDDPDDTPEPQPRGQRRGRPGPKRRDYSHLPAREDQQEIPESERVCPICGLPLTACGAEESEQIEFEIVIYRRIIANFRRGATCLYDTQLSGACLHAYECGGYYRTEALRGTPDARAAPPARARVLSALSAQPLSTRGCGHVCSGGR